MEVRRRLLASRYYLTIGGIEKLQEGGDGPSLNSKGTRGKRVELCIHTGALAGGWFYFIATAQFDEVDDQGKERISCPTDDPGTIP